MLSAKNSVLNDNFYSRFCKKKKHNVHLGYYPLSHRTYNLYLLKATLQDLIVTRVVPTAQVLALPFCYCCKKLINTLCGVVSDGIKFTSSVVKIGQLVKGGGGGAKIHVVTSFSEPVLFLT